MNKFKDTTVRVCNAAESLIIHKDFPKFYHQDINNTLLCGNKRMQKNKTILKKTKLANESDWYEEYLNPIIAVKIVNSIDEAIDHIEKYEVDTDSIISKDKMQSRFLREVDSSSVMVNTSTRFADGFEYGLGAEIGISTDKIMHVVQWV